MFTFYDDGNGQVLHHGEVTAAHITAIGLQEKGFGIPGRAKARAISEEAAIAAVGGVPDRV